MVVGLRVDLHVLACGSQWVSAKIRTTNCLKLLVVLHGLSLFGRQAAWWPVCIRGGVVKMVVGAVLAVAELWLRVSWALGGGGGVQARSSSCLAAEVQSLWCRQDGWWHCAVCL